VTGGGNLYAVGGRGGGVVLTNLDRYTPATDTWTSLAPMPTARAGLVTGIMLSLARAGGETAPLLLTALGNDFLNLNLLRPMASLPVQIFNYAMSPYEDWHAKAWGSALVLIAVIGALSLVARFATKGQRPG